MEEHTTITIRVPKELKRKAQELAKERDITLSQALRVCLREWLGHGNDTEKEKRGGR